MNVWFDSTWTGFTQSHWGSSWLMTLFLLFLQLLLIVTVAEAIVRWFFSRNPVATHRILVVASLLVLVAGPLRFLDIGWTMAFVGANERHELRTKSDQMEAIEPNQPHAPAADSVDIAPSADLPPLAPVAAPPIAQGPEASTSITEPPANESIQTAGNVAEPIVDPTNLFAWFISIYLFGCACIAIRFMRFAWRLHRCHARGHVLSEADAELAETIRCDIGLPRTPLMRTSSAIELPCVYGIWRPVVLLPKGFEEWPTAEKQAALTHELMHLRRRDHVGQLLAVCLRVLYWPHPICRYLESRLRQTRELATDALVVQSGFDAFVYVDSLLSIVSRVASSRSSRSTTPFAISMSAGVDLQKRLLSIIAESHRVPGRWVSARVLSAMAILAVTFCSTTAVLRTLKADEPVTLPTQLEPVPIAQTTSAAQTIPAAPAEPSQALELVQESQNDLIACIQHAKVRPLPDAGANKQMRIQGRVLNADLEPVAGASIIVRLTEPMRASPIILKDDTISGRNRDSDVLARVTTDASGRFELHTLPVPYIKSGLIQNFHFMVMAVHETWGIGMAELIARLEPERLDFTADIELSRATEIHGEFVSPDGKPIANAVVDLWSLDQPRMDGSLSVLPIFHLASPRAVTDAEGRFSFRGMPAGYIAGVVAYHKDWARSVARISVGDQVQFDQINPVAVEDVPVQRSPAKFMADPGHRLTGRAVDEAGQPVENVSIALFDDAGTISGPDGTFSLEIPRRFIEMLSRRKTSECTVRFSLPGSKQPYRQRRITLDEILSGEPWTLSVAPDEKTLRGRLDLPDGADPAIFFVKNLQGNVWSGIQPDGSFELTAEPGRLVIVAGTEQPGFTVPSFAEVRSPQPDSVVEDWPCVEFDHSEGSGREIPPLVVRRTAPIRVKVLSRRGDSVEGAVVQLHRKPAFGQRDGKYFEARIPERSISLEVKTNQEGLAELLPSHVIMPGTVAIATLSRNDEFHIGWAHVKANQTEPFDIPLEPAWRLSGRILLDGKPLENAELSLTRSNTIDGSTYPQRSFAYRESVRLMTDASGEYQYIVPAGTKCTVELVSLPKRTSFSRRQLPSPTFHQGHLRIPDIRLVAGGEQIGGTVVNTAGKPIAGVPVNVVTTDGVDPSLWVGHQGENQCITNAKGEFRLRAVPEGTYRLSFNHPLRRAANYESAIVEAHAGDRSIRVILADAGHAVKLPR